MKRLLLGFGAMMVLAIFSWPVAARGVDDFTIENFDVAYNLSRDREGRSVLKTTEKITVTFPQIDQNHGLERALPAVYNGHTTRLVVDSVVDSTGDDVPFEEHTSNDNTVLRIGSPDFYVHGSKTYVIAYTQHDVSRFFSDTNADEFYWDVNGTGWEQTIESVTAHVTIDESLKAALTGKNACYQGLEGKNEVCTIGMNDMTFTASRPLSPGENLTIVIGFQPGTFEAYQQTDQEKLFGVIAMIWVILLAIGSVLAVGAIVWMLVYRSKVMRRAGGSRTIPTQYIPPEGMSILGSAQIAKVYISAMTAQLLDLAVRHVVKIYQTKDKKLFQSAEYEIEITGSIAGLSQEEKRLLSDLYGKQPVVGDRFAMKKLRSDYGISSRLTKSRVWLRNLLRTEYGIFEKATSEAKHFTIIGTIFLILGIVTLSPLVVVAAIVAYWSAATLWPETKKGADLHDYLEGLKRYISLAESDRIKLLQSPEGVEKVGDITTGDGKMIKLYERVLGYAVLFGVEKEWMKQLGAYYEQSSTQPDWYAGNTTFNAVVFSSVLADFSDQTTSYSSPSNSSAGGSGGGGFSGGGGGGGGGSGW